MAPSTRLPHIVVLGSLNMDLVSYVPHHPAPGETLTSSRFVVSPGGKGANQAVACAKLSRSAPPPPSPPPSASPFSPSSVPSPNHGLAAEDIHSSAAPSANVSMVGCVGADSYGTQIRANLARHCVDVSAVAARQDLKTGLAVIIVDEPSGQNRIVLSPEANHALRPADVVGSATPIPPADPSSAPPSPAWLRGADLAILQLEIPLDTVVAALGAARRAGVPVLLNPAPMRADFPAEAVLRGLAHLVVNEGEAAMLARVDERTLDAEDGLESAARAFARMGVENVVITLGGRGVYYMGAAPGGANKKGLVPAVEAKVVDTTAAGDTFVGQYALEVVAAEARGLEFDIEAAVRKANRAAARTVEKAGAQDSIPWRDDLR